MAQHQLRHASVDVALAIALDAGFHVVERHGKLAVGGRLVGPFGDREEQQLLRVRRVAGDRYTRELIGRCRFVDLVGTHGREA